MVLVLIPFTFAEDNVNSTNYVLSDSSDNSYPNIYFDSSVSQDNGNGSIDNPYKYLTSNRIKENSNIYLADGEYVLDSSKSISKYNSFNGESSENTVIIFKNSGNAFSNSGLLKFNDLTLKGVHIYNTGKLISDNVIFRDS